MNLPLRRDKTLRILELKFDTVWQDGDWFIFIMCGSVMGRVKIEQLNLRQQSIFHSLKETGQWNTKKSPSRYQKKPAN